MNDDAAASGSFIDLLDWWKQLSATGPGFGYHVSLGWSLKMIAIT